MRNRSRTIASLKRLVERPGTPHEGDTAQRLLDEMLGRVGRKAILFRAEDFPQMTEIWYAYWCYMNIHGYVASAAPKTIQGKTWARIKFDHLKQPRWVPVVSDECGCHLSRTPFSEDDALYLHNMGAPSQPDWEELLRETYRRATQEARTA